MKEEIKTLLDKECYRRELLMQRSKFRQCEYLLSSDSGTSSWCWLCHKNDNLTDRLADIMEAK